MISVVKVSMKFDLDMADFNASKQTSLVNTMAKLLNIDSSKIKIVSIRQGSTIVDYQILPSDTSDSATVEDQSTELIALNAII